MKKDEIIKIINEMDSEIDTDEYNKKIFNDIYTAFVDLVAQKMYVMKRTYNEVILNSKMLIPSISEIIERVKDKLKDEKELIYAVEISMFLRVVLKIIIEPLFMFSGHASGMWNDINRMFERKLSEDEFSIYT